jgi:uncharacterized protein
MSCRLSKALHQELARHRIRVTALYPGPVPTEFRARGGLSDNSDQRLFEYSAEVVAEAGYRGPQHGRRIVVPGLPNYAVAVLAQFVPHLWLQTAIARHNRRCSGGRMMW